MGFNATSSPNEPLLPPSKSNGLITAVYRRELLPVRHSWSRELKATLYWPALTGPFENPTGNFIDLLGGGILFSRERVSNFCRELSVSDSKPSSEVFLVVLK